MYALFLSGALAAATQAGPIDLSGTPDRLERAIGARAEGDVIGDCPEIGRSLRGSAGPVTCGCPAIAPDMLGTSVWGNRVYTDDSNICLAAIHDGRVTLAGGRITVWPAPGQAIYDSAMRNGIASIAYRDFEGSFRFTPPARGFKRR
jgi:hypothetical protein